MRSEWKLHLCQGDDVDIAIYNDTKGTPPIPAFNGESVDCASLILEARADPNSMAYFYKDEHTTALSLAGKGDLSENIGHSWYGAQYANGGDIIESGCVTPLMCAAVFGSTEILELLLKAGAWQDMRNPETNETALMGACHCRIHCLACVHTAWAQPPNLF